MNSNIFSDHNKDVHAKNSLCKTVVCVVVGCSRDCTIIIPPLVQTTPGRPVLVQHHLLNLHPPPWPIWFFLTGKTWFFVSFPSPEGGMVARTRNYIFATFSTHKFEAKERRKRIFWRCSNCGTSLRQYFDHFWWQFMMKLKFFSSFIASIILLNWPVSRGVGTYLIDTFACWSSSTCSGWPFLETPVLLSST